MNYKCFECKRTKKKMEMNDLEMESIENYNHFMCSDCVNGMMEMGV